MKEGSADATNLLAALEALNRVREEVEDAWQVEPHSALGGDDLATAPWQTSMGVHHLTASGLDHMFALHTMIGKAKTLHIFAPYTLCRVAIENAATVIYLLAPPGRNERVRRRLLTMKAEIEDNDHLREITGHQQVAAERTTQIIALAEKRGISKGDTVGKPPGTRKIFRFAEAEVGLHRSVDLCWSAYSGIAHGRLHAAMAVLASGEVEVLSAATNLVHLEADPESINTAVAVVQVLTNHAWWLLRTRNTDFSEHLLQ